MIRIALLALAFVAGPAAAQTLNMMKGVDALRPHMIYQNTFYEGLDASF